MPGLPAREFLILTPAMNISSEETKVLFALIDAADELGLLRALPAGAKWPQIKTSITGSDPEKEGPFLWGLMVDLEHARVLGGSWIEDRWRTIRTQVERAKALTHHPFF